MNGHFLVTHSFNFSKNACKVGIFLNWSAGKDVEVKGQFVHVYSFCCYMCHEFLY